ncbi:MAG: fumarylacetoacetate hydrolase family protein [Lentisphaeraceae bacterium]|nr:fumarylacetoacetate hydrolase family protein [Lentisphaeraceae bacterium]
MKLIRLGEVGKEIPAIITENGELLDVSAYIKDFDGDFFTQNGLDKLAQLIAEKSADLPRLSHDLRCGMPVKNPGKVICVGLNFKDHAAESGMAEPDEPVLFFKATSALCGPNDNLVLPMNSTKVDWEVELAVIIGKRANYVSEADALDYVAGYCLHNDYSERAFQLERGGQWVKGKSCDSFGPLGPYICTDIEDPNKLKMWLQVNGEKVQDGTTANFVFNVQQVVSYISQFMTLMPGDIISTGTPAGVGFGMKPQRYLQAGDTVTLGIEGLGESSQKVVKYQR